MKPAVVVTGAAAGIGREFACIVADKSRSVLLVDRLREPLEQVAAELSDKGVEAYPCTIDLAAPTAGKLIEGALLERGLYCDVLVNNAGFGLLGPAVDTDVGVHLKMVAVHVSALTELTLRFLPGMIERRTGGIINVSSIAAYMSGPNMATYNASKAYVRAFSNAVAGELKGTGVTVTCLCPGMVHTGFWDGLAINRTRLFNFLPSLPARSIAQAGWKGFQAKKHTVIPQLYYKLAAVPLRFVPAQLIKRLTIGMFNRPLAGLAAADEALRPAIVVTGASSGIGRAIARYAAGERTDVVLVARSKDALNRLAAELELMGAAAHPVVVDLSQERAGDVIERALIEKGLYCDVIVNNAGLCLAGRASQLGLSEQLKLLSVNVRAVTELTMRFLPAMIRRRRGGVLNVGSIGAYMAAPNLAVYHASKAYVASLSDSLASEAADFGVTVTCLSPGVVRTPLVDRLPVKRDFLFHLTPKSSPEFTAEAGWRGLRAGMRLVIPSWFDRALAFVFVMSPRAAIPTIPVR
jgi:short-subunit dehydrogenase